MMLLPSLTLLGLSLRLTRSCKRPYRDCMATGFGNVYKIENVLVRMILNESDRSRVRSRMRF